MDSNPGTLAFPFKNIFKASVVAMPGDTVTIKCGIYELKKPFRPECSGTSSQWILYRAFPGDTVIFDDTLITKVIQNGDYIKFSRLTQGIFHRYAADGRKLYTGYFIKITPLSRESFRVVL